MNKEIEIKLTYKNKKELVSKLKKIGCAFKEKYNLHDTYYGFKNSMKNTNQLVRIREKLGVCELTFKGKQESQTHVWKRIELSCMVNDAKGMALILEQLGLAKIKENLSKREAYSIGSLEICFIDFIKPAKLSLVEIEGKEKEINNLLKRISDIVQKAGEEIFNKFDKAAPVV